MNSRWNRALSLLGAASLMSTFCSSATAQSALASPTPRYQITKSVSLGAPDHWDYVVVDADTHRVYVAHGDRVTVVDGQTGADGEIGVAGHFFALVPGHAVAQELRQRLHFLGQERGDAVSAAVVGNPDQHRKSAGTLHQGRDL